MGNADDTVKRATIYLDPKLHKALKLKSAESNQSLSELVNEAVRRSLKEDAIDLHALHKRRREPHRSFESFVTELTKSGLL